jgi:hypothetical protein
MLLLLDYSMRCAAGAMIVISMMPKCLVSSDLLPFFTIDYMYWLFAKVLIIFCYLVVPIATCVIRI